MNDSLAGREMAHEIANQWYGGLMQKRRAAAIDLLERYKRSSLAEIKLDPQLWDLFQRIGKLREEERRNEKRRIKERKKQAAAARIRKAREAISKKEKAKQKEAYKAYKAAQDAKAATEMARAKQVARRLFGEEVRNEKQQEWAKRLDEMPVRPDWVKGSDKLGCIHVEDEECYDAELAAFGASALMLPSIHAAFHRRGL